MSELPHLTRSDNVSLMDLRRYYPVEFYSNKTKYFLREIVRYVKEKRVFRISVMGQTRSGKSEVGSTISFYYTTIFNKFFDKGHFNDLDLLEDENIKSGKLDFNTFFVCDNQQVYKKRLKEHHQKGKLKYGQIWLIDENKDSTGGVGSMSEIIEMTNLNNIMAKFNQSEVYCQPLKFETRNCPYGLKVFKKDIPNRVNWCLLFSIDNDPSGAVVFKFLGWVKIPLHNNEDFRKKYNLLKNEWIAKELEGRADERMIDRSNTAKMLFKNYPKYFEKTESGKRFKYSKSKLMILVNKLIIDKKIHTPFNELEKAYIVEEALLIAEENG